MTWLLGDEVTCDSCGAMHHVSADSEDAWIALTEEHPATLAAYEAEEAALANDEPCAPNPEPKGRAER